MTPTPAHPKPRVRLRGILRAMAGLVTLGLLTWVILRVDRAEFAKMLHELRWRFALLAVCCSLLSLVCSSLRWLAVLRSQTGLAIRYADVLQGVLLAAALNLILPSKSGELAKAFYLRGKTGLSTGLGTVVLERAVDLLVLGSLGIAAGLAGNHHSAVVAGALLACTVLVLIGGVLLAPIAILQPWPRIKESAQRIRLVFRTWLTRPWWLALTFVGSLGAWTAGGATVAVLTVSCNYPLDLLSSYSIFILAVLSGLVPVSISGMGVRDTVFVILLGRHMPNAAATFVALGYTMCAYWIPALTAMLYFSTGLSTYINRINNPD